MPLPAGSALNQRDFRVFWSGQLVSLIGPWMQRVGQAWLVLALTNSPFKLGLISSLQFAPTCNTVLQLTAPEALRGRIMSLYAVVFAGVTPFGALTVGYVAEQLGTPAACAVGGVGGLLSVAILTMLWR